MARTGDDVITQGMGKNMIVPAGISPAGAAAHGIIKEGGYARKDTTQINSAKDLSNEYKALRDASPNMHQNADSYRVFGALCSRSLYKRALSQEDPVGYYLARRSQAVSHPITLPRRLPQRKLPLRRPLLVPQRPPRKQQEQRRRLAQRPRPPKVQSPKGSRPRRLARESNLRKEPRVSKRSRDRGLPRLEKELKRSRVPRA